MEDLLKMPSEYIDQVMYSIKAQQRHRSSLFPAREAKRSTSIEKQQQQQQRLRSAMTPTTQSTTSASNDS